MYMYILLFGVYHVYILEYQLDVICLQGMYIYILYIHWIFHTCIYMHIRYSLIYTLSILQGDGTTEDICNRCSRG